ncbi:MAG: thioredoxin domain-containing protein, partial [Alphaproteobacteria bacterium]|nr:thioredoxin domain-containing protein [Alphaproteobacteria bacterium]
MRSLSAAVTASCVARTSGSPRKARASFGVQSMSTVTFIAPPRGAARRPLRVRRRNLHCRDPAPAMIDQTPAARAAGAPMSSNRLAAETSPYLLQHAGNPVDWRPWGDAALAEARATDRPILLSVGYAACHWCHVMAHESFEDTAIAGLMNELFVNIKVDREERPDLDAIYQTALALMGEHGGWPLTMFCTPEGKPFWGGTYFPPEARWGRPGFPNVLRRVSEVWKTERGKIDSNVAALLDGLAQNSAAHGRGTLTADAPVEAGRAIARAIDPVHGGIGHAPKFPNVPALRLLWRAWRRSGEDTLGRLFAVSLDRMAQGGIYDHLGGGFARYATDDAWLVPHFEKMLYDNAQLVELYCEGWLATRRPLWAARVAETCDWVLRDLRTGDGAAQAFAATWDADSEGEEGRYYVWTAAEIDTLLGRDAALFRAVYDVADGGNWEGHAILNRTARPDPLSAAEEAILARCRTALLARRATRVPPGRDDKVLADWNGLMIAALARAATIFDRPDWLAAAREAFDFVVRALAAGDGRLHHSWRAGRARDLATLDDYANLARGALVLHEASGEAAYLDRARAWMAVVERHYHDPLGGGFFFTADDATDIIARARSAVDNAAPNGNGTLAEVLARLCFLTGERSYFAAAEATISAFSVDIARSPLGCASLLLAHDWLQHPLQVVVAGSAGDPAWHSLLAAARRAPLPAGLVLAVTADDALP